MGQMIMLKNVRCSYPELFKATVRDGETYPPGVAIMLDPAKDKAKLGEISAAVASVISGHEALKKNPPSAEKKCLRVGDRAEYEGMLILKANNPKPPLVLNADRTVATEATCKIYSGCYVNVKVEIWPQSNKWGRRVNAKLLAIQFAGDGESLDGSYVSEETAAEGFESLANDEFSDIPNTPGTVDINEFL